MTTPETHDPSTVAELVGELLRQEFWIVFKAFFAPIIGTIVVFQHLREEIRLTDAPPPP